MLVALYNICVLSASALKLPDYTPDLEWKLLDMQKLVEQSTIRHKIPTDLNMQPNPHGKEYVFQSVWSPQKQNVEYSFIINAHNRPHALSAVMLSTLMTVRGHHEIILFCDGCNNETLQVAETAFHKTWQRASRFVDGSCTPEKIRKYTDPNHALPDAFYTPQESALRSTCKDLDARCGRLQRLLLVNQSPAIWETAANNRAALMATGKFLIFMQDDMLMTQPAWNVQLSLPSRMYDDIFAVSARCAHHFDGGGAIGRCDGKIFDGNYKWTPVDLAKDQTKVLMTSPLPKNLHDSVDNVFVKPTANRGPLLYNHNMFADMGYFDETRFLYENDDHDINHRATIEKKWTAGFVPIEFHTLLLDRGSPMMKDNGFENKQHEDRYRSWRRNLNKVPSFHQVASASSKQQYKHADEKRFFGNWSLLHTLCA